MKEKTLSSLVSKIISLIGENGYDADMVGNFLKDDGGFPESIISETLYMVASTEDLVQHFLTVFKAVKLNFSMDIVYDEMLDISKDLEAVQIAMRDANLSEDLHYFNNYMQKKSA